MSRYRHFAVYKPYMMLSQFTDGVGGKRVLGDLAAFPRDVYPIGRLDEDSEGLLLLSSDPAQNARILGNGVEKEYWVQVEGRPDAAALRALQTGVRIRIKGQEFTVKASQVRLLEPAPDLPERVPPIRYRASIPTTWMSLVIAEGKNRQVRRMTAAAGFPTLRLVRVRIGKLSLQDMQPGEVRELSRLEV